MFSKNSFAIPTLHNRLMALLKKSAKSLLGPNIPYSHFCEYPGPTTQKHTTFPNQGRDINKSVNRGYLLAKLYSKDENAL